MRFLIFLFLAACTTAPKAPVQSPTPPPVEVTQPPVQELPKMIAPTLAWEKNHPERASWSLRLFELFNENLATFNSASDVKDYCPKWGSLADEQKATVLSTMAVAIALYESSYDPHSIYHEPKPLNIDSVGLFQLSYEDDFPWCTMTRQFKTLEDPITNINCTVPEMAKLVKRDGVIAQGSSSSGRRGLSRYWSTMWTNKKKAQVISATKALAFCK